MVLSPCDSEVHSARLFGQVFTLTPALWSVLAARTRPRQRLLMIILSDYKHFQAKVKGDGEKRENQKSFKNR
jgi:hypothetical protein